MPLRIGIERSPTACRIVEVDVRWPPGGDRREPFDSLFAIDDSRLSEPDVQFPDRAAELRLVRAAAAIVEVGDTVHGAIVIEIAPAVVCGTTRAGSCIS